MRNSMILSIQHPTDYHKTIGTLVRSFDNVQASGNFAVCRVRVNGKRYNRISCERDLLVYPTHPATVDGVTFYDACVAEVKREDERAYRRYVKACERENLNAHDRHMWTTHGKPTGPI